MKRQYSQLKWMAIAVAVSSSAAVAYLVIPRENPQPEVGKPGRPARPRTRPQAVDSGAIDRVPLTPRAIKKVPIESPGPALGWTFDFPWPPLESVESSGSGTRLISPSGDEITVNTLLQPVDWDQQFLDADTDARDWLKALSEKSDYGFYEAVLGATEDQRAAYAERKQLKRLELALAIKESLCPPGTTLLHSFSVGDIKGFQIGDPASNQVAIYVLPFIGHGIELNFLTRTEATFTQDEIDRVIGSLQQGTGMAPRNGATK